MSEHNHDSNIAVFLAVGTMIIGALLFYYDELITYPWAAWRYVDSIFWSNMPLPDFITVPHRNIVYSLEQLPSLRLLDYGNVYQVEYSVIYKTTWVYLLLTLPLIKRIVRKERHFDKFQKRLNFDQLIEQESEVWRYNRYLVNNNPVDESLDVNVGRYSCREMIRSGLKRTKIISAHRPTNTVYFNEKLAIEIFSSQLKFPIKTVEDIDNLPFFIQFFICIFSSRFESMPSFISDQMIRTAKRKVFALKIAKRFIPRILKSIHTKFDHKIIDLSYHNYEATQKIKHKLGINEDWRFQMLGDYSYHLNGEHDISFIQQHIKRVLPIVLQNEEFLSYFGQHAFAETLLRRLLKESRIFGKLSPSQFGYLKIINRDIWYTCTDEGLPGCSFEAAGIKSHYETELSRKRRHIFPMVSQAFTDLASMNLPKTADQFDTIEVIMTHPIAEQYPYDPKTELDEHLEKLKSDPEYRIQQTLIRQKKK